MKVRRVDLGREGDIDLFHTHTLYPLPSSKLFYNVSCFERNCGQIYENDEDRICELLQKCHFCACANF